MSVRIGDKAKQPVVWASLSVQAATRENPLIGKTNLRTCLFLPSRVTHLHPPRRFEFWQVGPRLLTPFSDAADRWIQLIGPGLRCERSWTMLVGKYQPK